MRVCIFCLIYNNYNILRFFHKQLFRKRVCFHNQAEMVLFRCYPYKKVVSLSVGQVCEALGSTPPLSTISTAYISWRVEGKGCRCVKLTTLPFHVPIVCIFCEASTSWSPQGLSRPVQGLLYLNLHWQHIVKMATRQHNSRCGFGKLNFVTQTRTANCRDQCCSRNVANCI
jgi:hypothetical protein